ncbi:MULTISPECIES: hypothetical protein [Gluconobacter]|uniref:DUF4123 domain-containing protein n=1 Tax=Gluconobacter cadivus TaxID=2728101 RepID=A0ABR9YX68_9PROT|nr:MULTISPECIES: hypothetical protein [Gluconobacter]MBF0888965.1 hypothetical protein [Gluconobacter cadivus]MBS1060311.1 hypothetical protein [Gluconobacter sp. Dm-44]
MTLPLLDGVKLDGFPVEQLYPGWSPSSRDVVADDFSVVVFKEDATGKQACWWLEGDDYCASHVLTLDEAARKRLLVAMDRVFWPLATGVLGAPLPPQASPSCETLPEIAVNELSGSWIGGFAPHTLLLPSGHADSGEALSCPNGRQIAENRLTALLAAQRGQGPLIVSSPFTALPLLAQITFQVQSLSVSRFQDADTVFYLIWNKAFPALRPSFYYPDAPMLISDDPGAAMIPGLILGWYARHPEHVSLIRDARPFRAEDFGVGQASGFRSTPPEETPPPSPPEKAPSYTLSQPPAPTSHFPASGQRLKSRIKSLFSRR